MKIAAAYNNGEVFGHFGRTEQFVVYQIEEGNIISREIKGNDGLSHADLVNLLASWNVDILFVGGIGSHAIDLLKLKGIEVYTGVTGEVEKNVIDYLNGNLNHNPAMVHQCSHH